MRLSTLLVILSVAVASVFAWTKDDYEIFDLVSELEAAEGKGTSFYSWMGISASATTSEITKAYRKKSLELHPDKNPGGVNLQERFARLGVINQILRSPERRERYNFFYKNGVPKWRGTGYYYSRYRPTLSHTLFFLIFLTSLFHLLVLRLNHSRDKRRVSYFQQSALALAGSGSGSGRKERFDVPHDLVGVVNDDVEQVVGRRVKVPMVEGMEMAGFLDLVVVLDRVYVPHEDGTLEPLSGLATPPSYFQTWPYTLCKRLFNSALSSLPPSIQSSLPAFIRPHTAHTEPSGADDTVEGFKVDGPATTPSSGRAQNGPSGKSQSRSQSRRGTETPQESGSTTDEENDEVDGAAGDGQAGDQGKKKKRGPGKAGGMRRRKAGMKK